MGKAKIGSEREWILEEMLKVAMEDEKNLWLRYRKLAKMAKIDKDREMLYKIADEEKAHLRQWLYIYKRIFGIKKIKLHGVEAKVYRFDIAIGKSITAEYEGLAFYKEILNRLPCEETKNILRKIMSDEQNHAAVLEAMMKPSEHPCKKRI